MLKKLLLILLAFAPISLQAQDHEIADEVLDSLYTKALTSRIDLMLMSGPIFFEENEVTARIENPVKHIQILSGPVLNRKALHHRNGIWAVRMWHRIISQDTIDINFGIVSITARRQIHFRKGLKWKTVNWAVFCGGFNGYQPDIRFVRNKSTNVWTLVSNSIWVESNNVHDLN